MGDGIPERTWDGNPIRTVDNRPPANPLKTSLKSDLPMVRLPTPSTDKELDDGKQ